MPLKIYFDELNHEPLLPTLVLANRNGDKIGIIPFSNLVISDALRTHSELSFKVYKTLNGVDYSDWDKIKDFQLLWCKEWNEFFELNVELNENNELVKNVIATSLGEAELSQTNLYNVEINTEDDIAREDYKNPTVFYDNSDSKVSLLNRILEKVPHYEIKHIDTSLCDIQRTFSFDNKSIYDSLQEIEEEINCLFVLSTTDNNGNLKREISAYDLESYCYACQHRGEFLDECPKCKSTNVRNGYGDDTTIYVSTNNLTDEITYSTDVDSVKNCFKLEAGDDLMTATITNCNPNGSSYIWYIPENIRKDMSLDLQDKLSAYDEKYENYQNEHKTLISKSLINSYNSLLAKYRSMFSDSDSIDIPSDIPYEIVGYSNLMLAYYDTIDFELFLRNRLMPTVSLEATTAQKEAARITKSLLTSKTGNIGVLNLNSVSLNTVTSIVTALVRGFIHSDYRVVAKDGATYNETTHVWSGAFNIYKYSDTTDSADTNTLTLTVVDTYSTYVSQQLTKAITDATNERAYDIVDMFSLGVEAFETELEKYGLNSLTAFRTICQACLDILIEQGISNKTYWAKEAKENNSNNLYEKFYLDYYNKLKSIDGEIAVREGELNTVVGVKNNDGKIISGGVQTAIEDEILKIQNELNFQNFLGEYWEEFISYRREDTYSNSNYISDGLDNAELLNKATEFLNVAKKEIVKSATLQHSISATLKNLLVMQEFSPLTSYFKVGNWLRICVDENVYRLRLMSYEIDFDSLETLNVTFSDVMNTADGYSDIESILSQAESMTTSYDGVMRQAKQGSKGNQMLQNWVSKGLDLTNMKIVGKASNQNISWDENGFLCREYSDITDEYDDRQLKIINRGLYVTDDGWETARAGIGNFTFYNPKEEKWQESYGVIADTLVGNLILSEEVGIYNTERSITLDKDGLIITVDPESATSKTSFEIRKKNDSVTEGYERVIYFNDYGDACFTGKISATSLYVGNLDEGSGTTLDSYISQKTDDSISAKDYSEIIKSAVTDQIDGKSTIFYQDTSPAGDANTNDLWFNTEDKRIYRCGGKDSDGKNEWVDITETVLGQALDDIGTVKAIADGKIKTYAQDTDPSTDSTISTSLSVGDLWIDTKDNKNTLKRWDGEKWASLADAHLDYLIDKVDGKVTTYYSDSEPENPSSGDLWFNTSTNILKYYYKSWSDASSDTHVSSVVDTVKNFSYTQKGKEIVNFAYGTFDGLPDDFSVYDILYNPKYSSCNLLYKSDSGYGVLSDSFLSKVIVNFCTKLGMTGTPTQCRKIYFLSSDPRDKYDVEDYSVWYNTTNGEIYILQGGEGCWTEVTNDSIAKLITDVATAQATADGKITTYYQSNAPDDLTEKDVGDLWIDSDDSNKMYRWNGKKWDAVRDTGIQSLIDRVDGIVSVYYQSSAPENPNVNDVWYYTGTTEISDVTDKSETPRKYYPGMVLQYTESEDGSFVWKEITADVLSDTLGQIAELSKKYDGQIQVYATVDEPDPQNCDLKNGDLWVNTNTNEVSYYNGLRWVLLQNKDSELQEKVKDLEDSNEGLLEKIQDYSEALDLYKKTVEKYLTFDEEDGLTIGAKGSPFKTVIDNRSMNFMQDNEKIAYIADSQIEISRAVIKTSMCFGRFFFAPHEAEGDEGFSVSWI